MPRVKCKKCNIKLDEYSPDIQYHDMLIVKNKLTLVFKHKPCGTMNKSRRML